jgi:hypothetical protein
VACLELLTLSAIFLHLDLPDSLKPFCKCSPYQKLERLARGGLTCRAPVGGPSELATRTHAKSKSN